jgi:hypothetical protein
MAEDRQLLFCAAPFPILNIDGGHAFAILQSHDVLISASHANVLRMCTTLAPLDSHAKNVAHRSRIPLGDAFRLLEELRSLRLLVDTTALTSEYICSSEPLATPNNRLARISIFTCNRVNALAECVGSYIDNCLTYGHDSVTIMVWDDSPDPTVRAHNRSVLHTIQSRCPIRIKHIDADARGQFCRHLSRYGVPEDVCKFGLLPELPEQSIGANRNAAILDTLDKLCLFVDDDTRALCAVHPERQEGIVFHGHNDPRALQFFNSRIEVMESSYWKDIDIINSHEHLLGKTLSECIGGCRYPRFLDPCTHMVRAILSARDYNVAITMPGKIGDCARPFRLWCAGSTKRIVSFDNLLNSSGELTREMLEVTPQNAIVHATGCMATVLGIDGNSPLPPFAPHFRNEDGVFGVFLEHALPNAVVGIPNYAALHAAETMRRYEANICIRFSDIIMAIVKAMPQVSLSGYSNLRLIGHFLVEISKQAPRDIQAQCEVWLAVHYAQLLEHIGRGRAACNNVSREVSKYLNRESTSLQALIGNREHYCPIEFSGYGDDSWTRLAREIGRLGELLIWWEPLHEATRDLRRKGITISLES